MVGAQNDMLMISHVLWCVCVFDQQQVIVVAGMKDTSTSQMCREKQTSWVLLVCISPHDSSEICLVQTMLKLSVLCLTCEYTHIITQCHTYNGYTVYSYYIPLAIFPIKPWGLGTDKTIFIRTFLVGLSMEHITLLNALIL